MSSDPLDGLLGAYRDAATLAASAEDRFRVSWREQLDVLETARKLAYQRMNVVADFGRAMSHHPDRAGAAAAVTAVAAVAFALERGRPIHDEILARFEPVAAEFAAFAAPRGQDEPSGQPPADPAGALAAFEAWYQDRFGSPFLSRADIAPVETPLVDW